MTVDQKRDPKGTTTGGQFAADVNPESNVVLVNAGAPTGRDETVMGLSEEYLESFAEEANENFSNWLIKKADEGEDWSEWTIADALSMMETFENMIRNRRNALLEDARKTEMKKIAGAS